MSVQTVRTMLQSWVPGKFDAELFMDGKAANPLQVTDGHVTGTNVSAAVVIPAAYGLEGFNLHTWTGWGSVPYWNAFVANLEMHGSPGTFFDPRRSRDCGRARPGAFITTAVSRPCRT